MYFKSFPKMFYDFSTNNTEDIKYVTNIFRRVAITAEMVQATSAYQKYIMKDGETAEIISHKLYGTPLYHWTIFLANDVINPYQDFAMTQLAFDQYVEKKYGAIGQYNSHHYEDNDGNILTPMSIAGIGTNCLYDPIAQNWTAVNLTDYTNVTNYDYEFKINETKRTINVIRPQFIAGVVRTFEDLMKQP
jgi:hypothetical protein